MSDEMLSQEEIEALLRGETLEEKTPKANITDDEILNKNDYLSPMEQDALGEVGNISFGSSATALSSLLGQKVEITTPSISMINRNKLEEEFPHPYVAIKVEYTTGLTGMNLLVIQQSDAAIIADLMLGGDGLNPNSELGEIQLSAVQEAMNQMMGSAATSMSTVFNEKVDISPPSIDLMNIAQNQGKENIPENDYLVRVSFRLKIGNLIDSKLMQLLPLQFSKKLVRSLLGEDEKETQSEVAASQTLAEESIHMQMPPSFDTQQSVANSVYGQPQMQQPMMGQAMHQMQQPMMGQPMHQMQQPMYEQPPVYQQSYTAPSVNVQQAQFASFDAAHISQNEARNLNMLLDIPLQLSVELGRTKRSVKEILDLASGSIIELDKLAGEPVDILVNNRLIAKGEVVVIDENFGVRITDILSQSDRLNNLR